MWMVYLYSTGDFEHETLRMVHFFALNCLCHVSAKCASVFRSCRSDFASLQSLITPYKCAFVFLPISLMFTRNISGPNTVPWGTPDLMGIADDDTPLTSTL